MYRGNIRLLVPSFKEPEQFTGMIEHSPNFLHWGLLICPLSETSLLLIRPVPPLTNLTLVHSSTEFSQG